MALLGGTIALLIYIVVIVLIFKFVKSVLKTVLLAALVLMVVVAGSTYFVYQDAKDLQTNFMNSSKRVLIADEGQIIAGFELVSFNNITYIDENLTQNYFEKDYKNLLEDNYKLIILNLEIFNETMEQGINVPEMNLNLNESMIKSILYSDDSLTILLDYIINSMINQQNIPEELKEQVKNQAREKLKSEFTNNQKGDIKSMIIGLLIKQKVEDEGANSLIMDYRGDKKGEKIYIYPETAVFKLIRFAPSTFVNKAVSMVG